MQAQLIDTKNKAVFQTCILTKVGSPGAFVWSLYMKSTSSKQPCQEVRFMKQTSCTVEENLPEKEKSPLRLLREQAGLTRPQVKQHIGVSERMQADWESGKSMPTVENVAALANLYQVSLKTMFELLGLDVTKIPDDLPSREPSSNDN